MPMRYLEKARGLDAGDDLRHYRQQFHLPAEGIYLDGNSLGAASDQALECLHRVIDEWKHLLIRGWTAARNPWFTLCEELAALSVPLVGAREGNVAIANSTTINLHHLLTSFFAPTEDRTLIVADTLNFPSDLYALAGQLHLRGLLPQEHLLLVPSEDGRTIEEDAVATILSPRVALVLLPSVLYRSGQLLDIPFLVEAAHRQGALIGFDLSHSVGVVGHQLSEWGVDFAFWCNYKYVSGGPGAPAGLFVHERHKDRLPGLPGWWGSEKSVQFAMEPTFVPAPDAGRWQVGTPPILSAAPLLGALKLLGDAGIDRIRSKSLSLTSLLIDLADDVLGACDFVVGTPREGSRRGGHVALEHPAAWQLTQALLSQGIVPDFRPPNVIRLAPSPLYNTHEDICCVVSALERLVRSGAYLQFDPQPRVVT